MSKTYFWDAVHRTLYSYMSVRNRMIIKKEETADKKGTRHEANEHLNMTESLVVNNTLFNVKNTTTEEREKKK